MPRRCGPSAQGTGRYFPPRRSCARAALSFPKGILMAVALRFGPLSSSAVHLCIDMQTLFAERTDWHVPWLERVLPAVTRLAEARRDRSVFTRFVPPERPEEAAGAWRRYYEHWRNMTGDRINPRLIETSAAAGGPRASGLGHRQGSLLTIRGSGFSGNAGATQGRCPRDLGR